MDKNETVERLLLLSLARQEVAAIINRVVFAGERECWEQRLVLIDKWRAELIQDLAES